MAGATLQPCDAELALNAGGQLPGLVTVARDRRVPTYPAFIRLPRWRGWRYGEEVSCW